MHFPYAPGGESHVDPGDLFRDREVELRHLTRPAAVLDALWRIVERGPKHRHVAYIGRWRGLRRRKLAANRRVPWARISEAGRIAFGVDGALRRLIWIAECGSPRRLRGGMERVLNS